MIKKLRRFDDDLKEQLKDKEFRRYYEEEGRKLEIGYKIAQLRDKFGLTQKQFGDLVDATEVSVSGWERGLRKHDHRLPWERENEPPCRCDAV